MTVSLRKPRARELGIPLPGAPGPLNAITDVPGLQVGQKTILEDTPRPGRSMPVRTGVTAILPRPVGAPLQPVYAGIHRFNGNGEMTGSHWIEDGGFFLGPVLITNTHSVGMAHHAAVKWMLERYPDVYGGSDLLWIMPVVAETFDGLLNDINGLHIGTDDVFQALDSASSGPVAEGNTGGGTGMIAYEFKGGTGTSSRRVDIGEKDYTIGALVQANHGRRDWFTVNGVPVGRSIRDGMLKGQTQERGSIIVVIATDIPMAPHQLKRVARRCSIGIGRNGTAGGNGSGDIFLAFSTGNQLEMQHKAASHISIEMLNDDLFDPVYMAVVECVEEAVLNAMLAAEALGGTQYDRYSVPALSGEELVTILRQNGVRCEASASVRS
jgi:L-aminopeptidase/D-esterase-like protein